MRQLRDVGSVSPPDYAERRRTRGDLLLDFRFQTRQLARVGKLKVARWKDE
jgi:hypothetical protein